MEQKFFSKNLHENRIQFPEERNPFVLDRQHGRRDVTCKPAIHMGILFMGVWVGEGGFVLNLVSLVLECVDLSEVPSQFTHVQSVLNQGEKGRLGPSIFLLLFYVETISKKSSNASLWL